MPYGGGPTRPAPELPSVSVDPVVWEGPPSPPALEQLVELDAAQSASYTAVYDSFMDLTSPQRDSARVSRRALELALRNDDFQETHWESLRLHDLGVELESRQTEFDRQLKTILNDRQLSKYRDWRNHERKMAEERARLEEERGPGGRSGRDWRLQTLRPPP
jgi:hypothetical protein